MTDLRAAADMQSIPTPMGDVLVRYRVGSLNVGRREFVEEWHRPYSALIDLPYPGKSKAMWTLSFYFDPRQKDPMYRIEGSRKESDKKPRGIYWRDDVWKGTIASIQSEVVPVLMDWIRTTEAEAHRNAVKMMTLRAHRKRAEREAERYRDMARQQNDLALSIEAWITDMEKS